MHPYCDVATPTTERIAYLLLEYVSPYSYTSKIEIAFGYFLMP